MDLWSFEALHTLRIMCDLNNLLKAVTKGAALFKMASVKKVGKSKEGSQGMAVMV